MDQSVLVLVIPPLVTVTLPSLLEIMWLELIANTSLPSIVPKTDVLGRVVNLTMLFASMMENARKL